MLWGKNKMPIYLSKDGKTRAFDRVGFSESELEKAAQLLEERGFVKEFRGYRNPRNVAQCVQLQSPIQVHLQEIPNSLLHELVTVLKPNYFNDYSRHEGTEFDPISEL